MTQHTDPFLDREWDAEEGRRVYVGRGSRSGVRWSGVNDPTTWVPRTDEQIRADAEAARARAVAFELSPRGQFLHATQRIAEHPAHAEASSRLVALYNRSLADDRQPLDTAAVGAALTVLAGLSGRASQDAVEALAQLLMGRK